MCFARCSIQLGDKKVKYKWEKIITSFICTMWWRSLIGEEWKFIVKFIFIDKILCSRKWHFMPSDCGALVAYAFSFVIPSTNFRHVKTLGPILLIPTTNVLQQFEGCQKDFFVNWRGSPSFYNTFLSGYGNKLCNISRSLLKKHLKHMKQN